MTSQHKEITIISLTKLKRGGKAKIIEVAAPKQMVLRLSALGLRPGASLEKIGTFVLRGPITVKVGRATIALGHSMAKKVMVEPRA